MTGAAAHKIEESPDYPPSARDGLAWSVLILTKNEAANLRLLLPMVRQVLRERGRQFEIVVVDAGSTDGSREVAAANGARVHAQQGAGYGSAFREGISLCRGEWIIALDADLSHPPQFLRAMVANCESVDMLIASRYVPGGDTRCELYRSLLSRILGVVFGRFLGIPVTDVSSGYRMYRRRVLEELSLEGRDFDILIETLIKVVSNGYRVREIPFIYEPRAFGRSNARLVKFAVSYLRTLRRMWTLRNSINSADYEERAYRSIIPLQRYWQRRRTEHVLALADRASVTLDIGSGASRISRSIPRLVALDINRNPLRFLKTNGVLCVQGALASLPVPNGYFDQVIMSQVVQHVPRDSLNLAEIRRVLRSNGTLVLATPDYASRLWRFLERIYVRVLPHAPGSLHVARYTRLEIERLLNQEGFEIEETRSVLGADIVYKCRRVSDPSSRPY